LQDLFAEFAIWFYTTFQIFQSMPFSSIFILLVSVMISTMSNLAMRRFSDMRRLNRQQLEIKQFQEMEKEANKTQNEKLLKKVKRRRAYIERIQREQMTSRCKPQLMFIIPFMIIFYLLSQFYTVSGVQQIVAIIPFNIQKVLPFLEGMGGRGTAAGFGLTYYLFYLIAGFGISSILQRIMGTQVMTPTT
jgi:uncharacterized membrane protein (DUF106 family)